MKELDETRIIRNSSFLSVYVPPKPPPQPDDYKRDFPPGEPPEVHYFGVTENYWLVLRKGKMRYQSGWKFFDEEEMAWLQSIKPQVEELLRYF